MNTTQALQDFEFLYEELLLGRIAAIEYGDPANAGGMLSFLRIRAIMTPGGLQTAVKELHLGREGSGIYFALNDTDGIKTFLQARLERIHHPVKLSLPRKADESVPAASFFGILQAELDRLNEYAYSLLPEFSKRPFGMKDPVTVQF